MTFSPLTDVILETTKRPGRGNALYCPQLIRRRP